MSNDICTTILGQLLNTILFLFSYVKNNKKKKRKRRESAKTQ